MSDTILVALIGASATVMTALFQIFMSSKQSASNGRSTKNRIKGLAWTVVLLVAAAGGGFAYSEYLVLTQDAPAQALRDRIGHTLLATNAAPRAVAAPISPVPATAPLVVNPGPGTDARDGVAASVSLPACTAGTVEAAATPRCTEQAAMQVALCAPIPATARVTEVLLYARPEGSTLPWHEHLVAAGQDVGAGRFVDAHFERPDGDQRKDVCQKFAHWNGESGRSVRIVVRYDHLAPAAAPTAQGASPPVETKPAG